MRYSVYGRVVGTKYLGSFEAKTPQEAESLGMAQEGYVNICHQCAHEVEDPEIVECIVEEEK